MAPFVSSPIHLFTIAAVVMYIMLGFSMFDMSSTVN